MDDDYPEQSDQERPGVEDPEELVEGVRVTIRGAFTLGLCFGLGFGLALIVYGIIALVVAKRILEAGL